MFPLLKSDLQRVTHSKRFHIVLSIAIGIVIMDYLSNTLPYGRNLLQVLFAPLQKVEEVHYNWIENYYPFTWYDKWIGANMGMAIYDKFYFIALPLFASFAMGDYITKDHTTGYVKQMFLHVGRKRYYCEKAVCAFLVGGVMVTIPLIVSILLNAAQYSSLIPMVESGVTPVGTPAVLSVLYFKHPFLYILCFLLNCFLYGGAYSLLSNAIGTFVSNSFIPLLFPFIVYLFENSFCNAIQHPEFSFDDMMVLTRAVSFTSFSNCLRGSGILILISLLALYAGCRLDETIG